jgi:hypothetical protein
LTDDEVVGAGLCGGYSLPFGSGWTGGRGAGGTFGRYSGPLTPHPTRDTKRPILKVFVRIAIMNILKTNN